MSDIKIESEFKHLLPPLTEEQKTELEKDIIKNGCLTPLVVWNNILIDGHHRYEICTKNNIPFDLTEMEFKDKLEAMEWIWSNQKNRRNLNKYELAQIALKFKPVIEEKAKRNQGKRNDLTSVRSLTNVEGEKLCQKSDEPIQPIDTKKELAKIAGVSHDTIHKVEVIEEKAPEDIKKQVKAGDLTINNAYILTKSAVEAKKKNEQLEREYQEELEKEKQEQEEKKKQEELEKALPENAVLIDKFRKPKETHIFGITDFNNLTEEQLTSCIKHSKKYEDAISKVALLSTSEDSLKAWNCVLDTTELIGMELSDISLAIRNLITIQNYFKGVKKDG
ncbi:ParB N-terminal domain-containing protein [Clostridium sp.]|uniref:ParB N-terminal domain-containing protein n=1 Tax=Clostridium sp. TaxID=1506 RepID=UPI0035A024B7